MGRLGFGVPGDLQQSLFGHERSGSGPKAAVDLEEDSDAEIEDFVAERGHCLHFLGENIAPNRPESVQFPGVYELSNQKNPKPLALKP